MKPLLSFLCAAVLFAPGLLLHGADPVDSKSAGTPAATPAPAASKKQPLSLDYKVPAGALKAPKVREQGGTRGGGDKLPSLFVLAPDHMALTSHKQPVLFWYQSAPASVSFELALVQPDKSKPLLSIKLDKAEQAGIRSVSLAQQNITLEPGIEYRWNIALVPDSSNRSKDKVASGVIKLVPQPAELKDLGEKGSLVEVAAISAKAGLWYDALQAISQAIARNPNDASLHNLRASLLEKGDLPEAAKAERR